METDLGPIYALEMEIPIALCCDLLEVSVTSADNNTLRYRGEVVFRDNIEHGIIGRHGWQAQPGNQRHLMTGRIYKMKINDTDPPWAADRFTLSREIDSDLRHHILHAILVVNPDLPAAS